VGLLIGDRVKARRIEATVCPKFSLGFVMRKQRMLLHHLKLITARMLSENPLANAP
jgi:hypothetical protein